jgi:hypothetical protein
MTITADIISFILNDLSKQPDEETFSISYIDEDEILDFKNNKSKHLEPDYCRHWHKLNKSQKINRLILYAQKLTKEYNLSTEQQIQLKQLFKDIYNVDNVDDIEYDSSTGQILKIKNLQRSMDEKREFYITLRDDSKPRTSFIINTAMVPLTFTELMNVRPVETKKKITIRKKITPVPVE